MPTTPNCTLIAAPYMIGHKAVGSVGIIGPLRLPYKKVFSLLDAIAHEVTRYLDTNLYKYKIDFRSPLASGYELDLHTRKLIAGPKPTSLL